MSNSLVSGAFVEFVKQVIGDLPRDISDDECRRWGGRDEELTRVLRAALMPDEQVEASDQPSSRNWPVVGEVFELTLDFDAPENDPVQMVRADGYSNSEKWKHAGTKPAGVQTRRFKLVEIGYQPSFDEVKAALAKHGPTPEGQWRNALKEKFPSPPGRPVGIADASWVAPDGNAYFPCVSGDGSSVFYWAARDFGEVWLWLVEVK